MEVMTYYLVVHTGPDAVTGGTRGHWSAGSLSTPASSQPIVYHQEERHQAEHHPVLCSHQWCGGREEGWLLPTATSSVRQKRSKGHNHTDGRFQRQDWNGQQGLLGYHGDTWTGTDERKWTLSDQETTSQKYTCYLDIKQPRDNVTEIYMLPGHEATKKQRHRNIHVTWTLSNQETTSQKYTFYLDIKQPRNNVTEIHILPGH